MNKDFIMWFLFGDTKRSLMLLSAVVCDYLMFNLML